MTTAAATRPSPPSCCRCPTVAGWSTRPGIRALSLWLSGDGIERAFADVFDLMEHCRFRDCKHDQEPGCAVRAAIADGALDPDRFASLERLVAEEVALEAEQRARAKTGDRRRGGRPPPEASSPPTPKVLRSPRPAERDQIGSEPDLVGVGGVGGDDGGELDRAVDVGERFAGSDEVLDDDGTGQPVGIDPQQPDLGHVAVEPCAVAATCSANEQWM